jgi:outer membrane protein
MNFGFFPFYIWMRIIIFSGMAIVLSGCCEWPDLAPDPVCCNQTPPEPSFFWVPNQFCPMIRCEMDEEDVGALAHKKLEVVDLIDMALRNNPTTQVTWANARAAAFNVGMARSRLYPTVDLQETLIYQEFRLDDEVVMPAAAVAAAAEADIQTNVLPAGLSALRQVSPAAGASTVGALGPGSNVILNSELAVSYLLLDFGGRCATIKAAREALYASDWLHNRQMQQVIVSVLRSYYSYQGLIDLLKARYSDLDNAKANLNAAQLLFDAGIKTKLDVLQAQSDLVNIELDIVNLQGQSQVTLGTLITNIGFPGNSSLDIAHLPEDVSLTHISENIDQLIATGLEQRPDLAAVYANHEQRRAEVTIARSAGLPTLSANFTADSNIYFQNPSFNNRIYTGSLALNIPLFSGFYYINQTRRAQELLRGVAAEIKGRELGVILDVITSYYDFKTAVESFNFSEKYLIYSQEAYEAALLSYRGGVGTILDLLSAQRTLANAKAKRVQARTNWLIALANVAFSTGILGIG